MGSPPQLAGPSMLGRTVMEIIVRRFGETVRKERQKRSLSIGQMARELGISGPYLCQIETGAKPASARVLNKIIEFLKLETADAGSLILAAAHSQPSTITSIIIEIQPGASQRDRDLASLFAFKFNRLSKDAKSHLGKILMADGA